MSGAKALVVDDEPHVRDIIARALERMGLRAECAESAEAGEDALRRGSYDLVLLDHVLPGMTGTQALRAFLPLTRAPIYLMSGYDDPDFRKDALLLGAAGFLPKPLEPAELGRVVSSLAGVKPG